ncbi:phosphoribosylglycinamide formyltransferase [Sphingomonas mali]|uniref:phosphoribosylglycinamide formyltransferase n=1 Tax=Sphingomonas mali TaxID=40682 RepID=UPI00083414D1|nr:phosphoribosylglycinamide formyltransferase [Sphingomonas mali]
MKKVGILISGRGSNMMSIVEHAGDAYEVVVVASDKPEAPGLIWAREHGIPTFALSPKGIGKLAYEAAISAALREAGAEIVALAGYMRLLSDEFVAEWRGRIINIHPSLLPKYKGLDTHARAIAAGDEEAGCSVHIVTEELDAGDVLGQARVPILPDDDADTLAERVLAEEHRLYPQVLADFAAR